QGRGGSVGKHGQFSSTVPLQFSSSSRSSQASATPGFTPAEFSFSGSSRQSPPWLTHWVSFSGGEQASTSELVFPCPSPSLSSSHFCFRVAPSSSTSISPSQLSSMPLQASGLPGFTPARSSSQSLPHTSLPSGSALQQALST